MTTSKPGRRYQRALTPDEMQAVLDGIIAATTPFDVIVAAAHGARDPLLGDEVLDTAESDPDAHAAPNQYAIPNSQWQVIVDAAHHRLKEWGNSKHVSLALIASLPSPYFDPRAAVPTRPERDFRPPMHELHATRDACDVIAACSAHLRALATAYGVGDLVHRTATESWNSQLCQLFSMTLGSDTRIDADGDLSLIVTTGGGTVYKLQFTPMPRLCTWPGCGAQISNDGTVHAATEARVVLVHEHTPDYPFDAPQPGIWQLTT